ncbi:MAG: ABC transporter substrate-binding protein [Burkholderiales bacterium]|jgi:branched-chain amino acid transport system substrate-binding protein|nr:ABC transporter substrate-binding protein [Burkholderiales bacterium]
MNRFIRSTLVAVTALVATGAVAAGKYSPGASDTEIRVGQTMPYSGPASAYAAIGKAQAAYFQMINEQGGVNGRKITFLSLDDGYSPPKAVEQTRKLVEQDEVLLLFNSLGTANNTATQKYLNAKKVPQLFVATGASKFGDPKNFPWTMGWQPNYVAEARVFAQWVLKTRPDAKIAVISQNDDFGKDYLRGIKEVLGDKAAKMIVLETTYEVTDPTVDSQVVQAKSSGADVLMNIATPKFAAQIIRKAADIGWKPVQLMTDVSASVGAVLTPAGLDKAKDLISASYLKDPTDARFKDDPAMKAYYAFLKKYMPGADPKDSFNAYGYNSAANLIHVLKTCGDDLTRENVMKVASTMKDVELPLLMPGIKVNTSPTDYYPIAEVVLIRFDGQQWQPFGDVMSGR